MMIRSSALAAFAAALTLFASSGCETLPPTTGEDVASPSEQASAAEDRRAKAEAAEKEREAREEELRELEAKLVKLERQREVAKVELDLTEQQGEDERVAAQLGVADAERELQNARRELKHFTELSLPLARAQSKLDVDRAARRLADSQEELKEILVLYEDEVDAVRAKEIVVARHQKAVEFAERSLAIAEMRAEETEEKDLVEQREKLERAVTKAEEALAKAGRDADRQERGAALDRLRKEHAILDVEEEVADTVREIQELQGEADEAGDGDDPSADMADG